MVLGLLRIDLAELLWCADDAQEGREILLQLTPTIPVMARRKMGDMPRLLKDAAGQAQAEDRGNMIQLQVQKRSKQLLSGLAHLRNLLN